MSGWTHECSLHRPLLRYKYSLFLDPRDAMVQTWVMGPSDDYDVKLRDETRYGFGFGYVYRKKLVAKVSYNATKGFGRSPQSPVIVMCRQRVNRQQGH